MFVRTIHQSNGKVSILVVENIRQSGKVRQKKLFHVGTVSEEEVAHYKDLAEFIKAELENKREAKLFSSQELAEMVIASRAHHAGDETPLPVNLRKLREESRIVTGIHDIYGSFYDEVGFSRVFKTCPVSKKVMKDIVMARLAKPCSKRSSCELLEKDFGIRISLEKIYRMMDTLTEDREQHLQDKCWNHTRELFTEEIKVMFYDCTTLYFESFTEDELRRFGYSKDHKFNQGQVLLALMVTQEGLPVGYDVFPGNMSEGDTFKQAIEKLKQKLQKSKKPESLISNYGYQKFITVEGAVEVSINEEKLAKEALWDGLHGIFTNIKEKDMQVEEVITQYHGLWQVEESFRINKHDLRMRPVFH